MSAGKPLTAEKVARIREVHEKEPELTRPELAERFGVSWQTIAQILKGVPRQTRREER